MKSNEDNTGEYTDGGTATQVDSDIDVSMTRLDRYRVIYNEYIYAPLAVIRNDIRGVLGLTIVGIYVIAGTLGPMFIEPTQTADGPNLLQPFQNMAYPFGTNTLGQDLFAQTIYSTTPILKMVIGGAVFTVVVATIVGTLAGYKGGLADRLLATVTDVFINLPGLPLIVVLATMIQPRNPFLIGVILSVARWAGLSRNLRSQVLTLRSESFVEATRIAGLPVSYIIIKDILPHLMPYIMINFVNSARKVIYAAVGLYFIGVLPYSANNWGVMLSTAYDQGALATPAATHWVLVPVFAIVILSLGLILLSQSFDRVFNPRVRAKHAQSDDREQEDIMGEI